jgi:hypothetical protein
LASSCSLKGIHATSIGFAGAIGNGVEKLLDKSESFRPPMSKNNRQQPGPVAGRESLEQRLLRYPELKSQMEALLAIVENRRRENLITRLSELKSPRLIWLKTTLTTACVSLRVKLGLWNTDSASFEPIDWVPPAGALVIVSQGEGISATPPTSRCAVGKVPHSAFPVHVHISDTITHNTALIGVRLQQDR